MKRLVLLAVCLALASASACSKKPAEESSTPPADSAASTPAADTAAAAQPAAEPKQVEITDGLVAKYIEFQKENLVLVQQYVAESKKNLESAKGDTAKTLNQISINQKLAKEMDAKLDAKRQALGLSHDELNTLKDAAGAMAAARTLYNQMGGDAQLAKMEAEQKAEIARLPEDKRAAAEEQMAVMTKSLRDVRDGADLRKKYGDKSADVLLKHADALAKQWEETLKLMKK